MAATHKSGQNTSASSQGDSDAATPKKTRRARVRISTEPLTPEEHAKAQEVFLDEYAKYGNVTAACKKAGIHRATVYRWQEEDETFSLQHKQAKDRYCDKLRHEIDRRATQGVLEPVVSAGRLVTRVRKYSDVLLMFQAKAHMPEYRDKMDVTSGGEPVKTIFVLPQVVDHGAFQSQPHEHAGLENPTSTSS